MAESVTSRQKRGEITFGGRYPGTPTWRFLHCPQGTPVVALYLLLVVWRPVLSVSSLVSVAFLTAMSLYHIVKSV